MEHSNNVTITKSTPLHQNHRQEEEEYPSPSSSTSSRLYPWRRVQAQVLLSPLNSDQQQQQPQSELSHISFLISANMLACTCACIAAIDAKVHCHSQQIYEINELFDDDQVLYTQLQRIQQEALCQNMFRIVTIPITTISLVCSVLAKCLIRRQSQHEFRYFFPILILTTSLTFISWLYGIFSIMLRPKNLSQYNNQFQSLAAVDQMGHVGDNANLYYLSWICMGLSLSILYHTCIEAVRHYYNNSNNNETKDDDDVYDASNNVEVTATFSSQLQLYRESQNSWYHSLYRLRIRSGIWVSALLATLVVLASSLLFWRDVLAQAAKSISGRNMKYLGVCRVISTTTKYAYKKQQLPPELCGRTAFSIASGATAGIVCLIAILIHMSTRHAAFHLVLLQEQYGDSSILKSPLRVEFVLSAVLCTLLGFNAVVATGVQGPAASVGNLYYASWGSFLLCLRILLGCIEEVHNLHHEQHYFGKDDDSTTESSMPNNNNKSVSTDAASMMAPDLFDNARARKSRRFLFLGIVSTICSASALDACLNQSSDLTWDQRYVIIAPTVIAVLCAIQFIMCLGPVSYLYVSSNLVGGTLAILMFLVWLVDLIITMHSHNSWAVNAIGDIKIANLYYFSWASIVTAGLHMSTFMLKIFGVSQKDYMTVVWSALVKICVVILGASWHIWYKIQGSCSLEDMAASYYAIDFCSRTVFSIMVSLVGMAMSGLVVLTRVAIMFFCPFYFAPRIRAHVEMIVACFLVLVFAVAVAIITGIGGPGQSVGDLYYATWLAFLVSLFVGATCYSEIATREDDDDEDATAADTAPTGRWAEDGGTNEQLDSNTNFVQMT